MKKYIKKIMKKIFYRVFPELMPKDNNYKGKYEDIKAVLQNLINHIDKSDKTFLQEYDKKAVGIEFEKTFGYGLPLETPKTFNEKIQWLKIYQRKPEMTVMADKFMVREYLTNKGFAKYLNTLYGVYYSAKELKSHWDELPEKFVIKVNHLSGGVFVVKDKNDFQPEVFDELDRLLKTNYYSDNMDGLLSSNGEWAYKDIKPCIIVEEYLEDNTGGLLDYKIHCFNGRPYYIQVDIDRFVNHTRCFYDIEWEKMPFTTMYPLYSGEIDKPKDLMGILRLSEELSKNYINLRVDWYYFESRIVFGELTFFHGSGRERFYPSEWDLKLGELIKLPIESL